MPTYQYACTACDHRFDAVQSFTENSLTVCPQCSGRLRKIFSAVGVVFKGSGFYRTDSRTPESANGSAGKDSTGDKVGAKDPAVMGSGSNGSGSNGSGSNDSGAREPARTSSGSNGSGSREPGRNGSGRRGSAAKSGSAASGGGSSSSTGSGSAA